jgi:alkyl sulfatase BDS1-like metallo-beta-lactamase superfamily hydrolase
MKKSIISIIIILSMCVGLVACGGNSAESDSQESSNAKQKEASELTAKNNQAVYDKLDFDDNQEFEFANKGLITSPSALSIKDEEGKVVWSQDAYDFLDDKAPDTVNPSLWRNTQLNHIYGLFEVTDGIYQVRGYDMTNITFIEGDTGWIVFDPLMSTECSEAAMNLVNSELGKKPVKAIVISHPHVDHYGGIEGIVSQEDVTNNDIPIITPENFEEHAVTENVFAGTAMSRRANYQYGPFLEANAKGKMSIGIGMGQSRGHISYMSPTDTIKKTGETRTIDGITMEFQLTPGTESPAEMNTWFPEKNALWLAENCTGTLHNLYTLRGAEVRDGNKWAEYIMESMTRYGKDVEVVFQSHNWPHWGNDFISEYMSNTAAMYKFINDQTLLYINQGYTSKEIASMIELPADLEKVWYTRQYYGTLKHNSKAVYQKYMGWYTANPVELDALEPTESAEKFVEYMGDSDTVLEKAHEDFDNGEYQWVAEITNILVFADPKNKEARLLCADALEQLGYQAESGTWRNAYLTGAKELREGGSPGMKRSTASATAGKMTPDMLIDYLGILFDSNQGQNVNMTINMNFNGEKSYLVTIKSGVILYQEDLTSENADSTWNLTRADFLKLINGDGSGIKVSGDKNSVQTIGKYIQKIDPNFNIVEP